MLKNYSKYFFWKNWEKHGNQSPYYEEELQTTILRCY